jgi:hypothetical protein
MAQHRIATWLGTLLGLLGALLAAQAHGSEALHEDFHQVYPVHAAVRIALENLNGGVQVTAWDRNEVKLDAVKSAHSQKRMAEARIQVAAGPDYISIHTEYIGHNHNFDGDDEDNPATVTYTLTVPRGARLDEIKLINGALDIQGVEGEVHASSINGKVTAHGLAGRVRLSTINNMLDAQFERLSSSPLELSSINGKVLLTLPSDAKADLEAATVHGPIESDFALHVRHHQWGGRDLRVQLGGGGKEIKLDNVNGPIEVKHASDGKTLSPAKDLGRGDDEDEI